jgi:hypothetical protein
MKNKSTHRVHRGHSVNEHAMVFSSVYSVISVAINLI